MDDPIVQANLLLLGLFKPEKCWRPVINTLVNSEVNSFQRHSTVSVKTRSKSWMTSPLGTIRLPINQFYYQLLNKEKRTEHDKIISWKMCVHDAHFGILGLVVNELMTAIIYGWEVWLSDIENALPRFKSGQKDLVKVLKWNS